MPQKIKSRAFRSGPHPMPVHLGMAVAAQKGIQEYVAPYLAVIDESELTEIIRGIQLYQSHPYKVRRARSVIWSQQCATLSVPSKNIRNSAKIKNAPLLLVPSLVNKADILDLCASRSLFKWLNKQGVETYLFDWGDTSNYEDQTNMEGLVSARLCPAVEYLAEKSGGPVSILGYCMGGTISLAATSLMQHKVRKLVLMAAPWDFKTRNPVLSERVRTWAPVVMSVIEQKGCLPAEWTQALFATLDPEGSAKKFARFARMDQGSEEAKLFVAVEDWLNDGVDLSADIALHCLRNWFAQNAPERGEWKLGGRRIDPSEIKCPVMIIASTGDRLVPFAAAASVREKLTGSSTEILKLECGHISLIAGSRAVETVWTPIAEWLAQ